MSQDRAILSISSNKAAFRLYLPSAGDPQSMSRLLQPWSGRVYDKDPGQLMVEVTRSINPEVHARLVETAVDWAEDMGKTDRLYQLSCSLLFDNLTVHSVYLGARQKSPMFRGNVSDFHVWARSFTGHEHLLRKVVQFYYDGGTRAGPRTIRVEKVEMDNGHLKLSGIDLAKPDLKRAYRDYLGSKIKDGVKGIKLLN
jgi:hypothetical protein